MRRALAFTLLCLPFAAYADCAQQFSAWARQLQPQLKLADQYSVCKPSPSDPSRTLAALLFVEKEDDDGAQYGLAVLSAKGATVERQLYEPAAITTDAITLEEVTLDTARYNLAPSLRAFGVRARYSGPSRVNQYSSTQMNLYLDQGGQLRKVLDGFEVEKFGGEWDGNCAGEFSETHSSLAVGKATSHGLADLEVTEKTVDTVAVAKGDDCNDTKSAPKVTKYSLSYDGQRYQMPSIQTAEKASSR
ncbi:hypothetical protein RRX38_20340 [Pseudomonas sp. DTU_2021_1001937_2_SI_NGA_ILE_001]|uniref:hypothetical protein n=1 Tax=Pseudomonas sp. DTU_2021_1001937_2_SI_NGA_ILE_001 TaxID=3077589 RepID=UPI0028FC168F|nr:hypothetical protein [Pseudomonas sp. DTU_2021_1001937_2_SI_NGA_ILE_001]WNW13404.1 hypothetical protein RRX38_20340 [Pseudomonas sp. DTU_2021_1001937_2_SI_NGA_ILE_001]